ncbi:MAG TPA: ABC transporter permease [Bryobacteraceae bacterium]|nr:ABC transporter permease [Bryobacteraceae bacterium]
MNALWKDLIVAIRQFRRQPGFAVAVVSTLALAIGANITVFSVVDAVLFRALPFTAPERLVWIASVRPDNPAAPFSLPEFMDYRSRTRTLSDIAAYTIWGASLAGDNTTEGLQGARISSNAFDVLGLTPAAGRLLRESDDRPDAPKVAVLSYRLWQRRFGGAAGIAGSSVRLNGESFAIAGILPPHFPFPFRDVDVFVPLVPDRDPYRYVRNSTNFLRVFGRLNPGSSSDQAQAELTTICRSLRQQFPVEYARKDAVRTVALHEVLIGDYRQSMVLLLGAVLVVLGTALANLVSLVLVRANERRAELSIRVAIGASRLHLARQLMVESLLHALIGSGLGWMLATWAISIAVRWAPSSIPRLAEVSVDGNVLGFAALIAIAAAVVLTVAPLGTVLKARAGDVLRLASRGTGGDRWSGRVRQALVIGEISAALLLLLATTVLLQNVLRLQDVQPGFRPDSVFQARISIPPAYQSADDVARFYERLSERLVNLPGVRGVGVTSIAPLSGLYRTVPFTVEGEAQHERDLPSVNLRVISPGYLSAIGTHLLSGRSFSEADRSDTPPVALVSAAFAERVLHRAPLGRRLLIHDNSKGPRPVEIVGVVEDVRQMALDTPPALDVYLPLRQVNPDHVGDLRMNQFWMIRTGTAPAAFRSSFATQLRAVDEDAAITGAGAMRDYVEAGLGPRRFNLGLFAAFSLTGVLLAVFGLYALVSYGVSQRQREIGLRMAIGATERDIHRMILRQAALLGLTGAALGGCLAGIARPLVSGLAQDVSIPFRSAIATTGLLVVLVTLAAWLPARRAARIPPTVALRGE